MLNDKQNYFETWRLKINISKTIIMIFETGRRTSYDFYIYNTVIDVVDSFNYLGIKVQVGKDQEKAQSEKDSHSNTEVGKKQTNNQVLIP